jgi:hypothetical protein
LYACETKLPLPELNEKANTIQSFLLTLLIANNMTAPLETHP